MASLVAKTSLISRPRPAVASRRVARIATVVRSQPSKAQMDEKVSVSGAVKRCVYARWCTYPLNVAYITSMIIERVGRALRVWRGLSGVGLRLVPERCARAQRYLAVASTKCITLYDKLRGCTLACVAEADRIHQASYLGSARAMPRRATLPCCQNIVRGAYDFRDWAPFVSIVFRRQSGRIAAVVACAVHSTNVQCQSDLVVMQVCSYADGCVSLVTAGV